MAFELGRDEIPKISSHALKALESYIWPGNIRELKNVIERAVYKSYSDKIKEISFNPFNNPFGDALEDVRLGKEKKKDESFQDPKVIDESSSNEPINVMDEILKKPFKQALGELEFYLISKALKECRFNQKNAAKRLGLSYDQFRGIKKKYSNKI